MSIRTLRVGSLPSPLDYSKYLSLRNNPHTAHGDFEAHLQYLLSKIDLADCIVQTNVSRPHRSDITAYQPHLFLFQSNSDIEDQIKISDPLPFVKHFTQSLLSTVA